jgi:hypothetical protein
MRGNLMTPRRFPPLWTVGENAESFWVQDAGGQTVGWFYFRHNEETARQAKVLTGDEARRWRRLAAGNMRHQAFEHWTAGLICVEAPIKEVVQVTAALRQAKANREVDLPGQHIGVPGSIRSLNGAGGRVRDHSEMASCCGGALWRVRRAALRGAALAPITRDIAR